jgi:O-antigen ligase
MTSLINLVWLAALGLGAVTAFVALTTATHHSPRFALLLVGAFTATQWEYTQLPQLFTVAGANVFPNDVVCGALLVSATLRFSRLRGTMARYRWIPILFVVILIASLSRGLFSYELGAAVNEFRLFFWVIAVLVWAATVDWSAPRARLAFEGISLWLGWTLSLVAALHIAQYGLGGADAFVNPATGIEQTSRPLVAGQALVLALCAIVGLGSSRRTNHVAARVGPFVFIAIVLISQHRTVWAAIAVGLVALFVDRGVSRSRVRALGFMGLVLVIGATATGVTSALVSELSASLASRGTYDGRVTSWIALLRQFSEQGALSISFGQPMGFGYGRFEGAGRFVTFAPHNWYLTVLLRMGIAGLVLLVASLVALCVTAARRAAGPQLAIVLTTGVFGWAYSWPWYAMPFLGFAIAALLRDKEAVDVSITEAETSRGPGSRPRLTYPVVPPRAPSDASRRSTNDKYVRVPSGKGWP